ncbi:hypothetical protein M8J77_020441 [Diaphorina citri]|nr:hypothetical protein M8J77_020441 [Diaphorina citri]
MYTARMGLKSPFTSESKNLKFTVCLFCFQTSPIPQSEEPSPTTETEIDVVRSTSKISITCAASLCRTKSTKPRALRSYVTRRTSRRAKPSAS